MNFLRANVSVFMKFALDFTKLLYFQEQKRETAFKKLSIASKPSTPYNSIVSRKRNRTKDFQKSLDTAIATMIQYYC